jgi:hypothetical protein
MVWNNIRSGKLCLRNGIEFRKQTLRRKYESITINRLIII